MLNKRYALFICFFLILAWGTTYANTNYCTRNTSSWFNVINKLTGPHAATIKVYFANVTGDCTDTSNGGGTFGEFLTLATSSSPMYLAPGQSIMSRAQVTTAGAIPYDILRGLFMDINPQNRDANCKFDTYVSWTDPVTKKYYSYHFGTQLQSIYDGNYCNVHVKDFASL